MASEGTFAGYGGRHVPEPLEEPLAQLASEFEAAVASESFHEDSSTCSNTSVDDRHRCFTPRR